MLAISKLTFFFPLSFLLLSKNQPRNTTNYLSNSRSYSSSLFLIPPKRFFDNSNRKKTSSTSWPLSLSLLFSHSLSFFLSLPITLASLIYTQIVSQSRPSIQLLTTAREIFSRVHSHLAREWFDPTCQNSIFQEL